jgi:pSer/pThr/pTyr-binding forkhead associated (FHA) protein
MPQLIVWIQDHPEETHALEGEIVTIGSRSDNAIQVRNHAVSGHHGQFVRSDDGGYRYEDLHSTNGSYLDGEAITNVELKDGDVLSLGVVACTYRADVAASPGRLPKPPFPLPKIPASV